MRWLLLVIVLAGCGPRTVIVQQATPLEEYTTATELLKMEQETRNEARNSLDENDPEYAKIISNADERVKIASEIAQKAFDRLQESRKKK